MTWRQYWCWLRAGHDRVLAFVAQEGGLPRMVLRCTSCQHETSGVSPAPRPPVPRYAGDARRHALRPHRLVTRRRA